MPTKRIAATGRAGRVVLVDSITMIDAGDAGAIVVAASHGGTSSAAFALEQPLRAVFFNDAGVGKDDAGIAALGVLQARGVAAGTVSHLSCRIGDSDDMWANGVISHANDAARACGVAPGESLRAAIGRLIDA